MEHPLKPVMDAAAIEAMLEQVFPQIHSGGQSLFIDEILPAVARVRLEPDQRHLRPGGTVSGPSLFSLADIAAYAAILGHLGPVALAVTTNLNINFLRKPEMKTLIGTCRIIKLGKRLCVTDIGIAHNDAPDGLVAHATATYSIPPR